jgi:hypothetical protein
MFTLRCRQADIVATGSSRRYFIAIVVGEKLVACVMASTPAIIIASRSDTGYNVSPVSLTPANILLFVPFDTGVKHKIVNFSENFLKNYQWPHWETHGPGGKGKLIHEKNLKSKISCQAHKHDIFFSSFFAETESLWFQGPVTRDF